MFSPTQSGDFTFDYIPDGDCEFTPCEKVDRMLFPLPPVNATNISVLQDGVPVPWSPSSELYPTVLQEYPFLDMFEWGGPFPGEGAVFTVNYEHDVFPNGDDWVLFYSLGTGKFFPTYDKITTAIFDIYLPKSTKLVDVLLDDMPVDPRLIDLDGSNLKMTLTSEFALLPET